MKNFIHVIHTEQFELLYHSSESAVYPELTEEEIPDVAAQYPEAQGYLINGSNLNQEYDLIGSAALPEDRMVLVLIPVKETELDPGIKHFGEYIDMLRNRSHILESYYSPAQ